MGVLRLQWHKITSALHPEAFPFKFEITSRYKHFRVFSFENRLLLRLSLRKPFLRFQKFATLFGRKAAKLYPQSNILSLRISFWNSVQLWAQHDKGKLLEYASCQQSTRTSSGVKMPTSEERLGSPSFASLAAYRRSDGPLTEVSRTTLRARSSY